ncbi:hypothetical protein B0H21DRAFT_710495 [Amylocystis lapponica]|nr:hypothetical protein B0H21DRAFT_710495 [Amylocystis lapponica]
MAAALPPGTAPVKPEFLISIAPQAAPDDDAAEGSTAHAADARDNDDAEGGRRLSGAQRKNYRGKKKRTSVAQTKGAASRRRAVPTIRFSTTCPVYERTGECKHGYKCRFLGGHVRKSDDSTLELIADQDKVAHGAVSETELNFIDPNTLKLLRTKSTLAHLRCISKELQDAIEDEKAENHVEDPTSGTQVVPQPEDALPSDNQPTLGPEDIQKDTAAEDHSQFDTPDVPMRPAEKKRLHWNGMTSLPPPLCRLRADITCGEMGLAASFLQGSKEEWSLVRRHPSERTFGVQLAGNKPALLVPTAETIARECAGTLDFVDVNCGCPIDLVYKAGSGSALLDAAGKLGKIIVGMNRALGDVPVTVKLRTGVKDGRNTAHRLMPRLGPEWDAAALTLHGRTRQQRYTKLADWDYIKQCVDAVRAREAEEDLSPVPIFGGGDCFSAQDYWEKMESSGVDGVMVGRGALIKPWIFTEIKERREWDISARERLELVRKYAEYGLSHFGTDTAGVNTTRRYLCEALSFQYRYVPIGLLEVLPGRLNDRAPAFRGRNELVQDWVKISEMFLGPAPETWTFTPKHKSNSYESQG